MLFITLPLELHPEISKEEHADDHRNNDRGHGPRNGIGYAGVPFWQKKIYGSYKKQYRYTKQGSHGQACQ